MYMFVCLSELLRREEGYQIPMCALETEPTFSVESEALETTDHFCSHLRYVVLFHVLSR